MASTAGYDKITDTEIISDKEVKFTFSEPYAGWKDLFIPVYPKHAIEGENFNKIWNKGWVGEGGIAQPEPDEAMTLDHGIGAHAG